MFDNIPEKDTVIYFFLCHVLSLLESIPVNICEINLNKIELNDNVSMNP